MGRVQLSTHHIQGIPGDHRNSAKDARKNQNLCFGLNHIDEEDAQAGHQQATGCTTQQTGRECLCCDS